ncbi:MAG: K+ transport system, NAD-binding component [uncultured archaeon A07HB70]|nr:MAG: K+ transport system, NAD-binding component [uncultured archaeon A07HB70]
MSESRIARLGTRATVSTVAVVALLSVITGVVNVGTGGIGGPFARLVPNVVQQAAGFTGALTGFLVLASAASLHRGYRLGWYASLVLLPVTVAQGLVQSSALSVPLVVASTVAVPTLLLNRQRFTREFEPTPTQLAAVAAIVGAQAYGTVGTFVLRTEFSGVETVTDAFYFTVVTGSTVGYGDITPQSPVARLFGLSALLVNVAAFAVALGVLLTPAIEARLAHALGRMNETDLEQLDRHVVVLGYGDLTEPVLDELGDEQYLVVTPEERARGLREHDVPVLAGDPSDEETLNSAGVERARAAVAATNDDAADALAILTARQLNPDLRIVAAVTHRENVRKLERAGANTVISPATIGGRLLVRSALGDPADASAAERTAEELMGER